MLLTVKKWIFGNTKIVERNVDFLVSEITREKIFNLLNKELPYVIKIESSIKDLKTLVKVEQRILVEKDSQKRIIIGKGGSKIKDIGMRSRLNMEKFFKKKVFLELKVIKKSLVMKVIDKGFIWALKNMEKTLQFHLFFHKRMD